MIGYGGMAGCAVAMELVAVIMVEQGSRHIQSLTFLCTFISDLFYFLFFMNHLQEYKINNGKQLKAIILRLLIVLGGLIAVYPIANDVEIKNVKFTVLVFLLCIIAELAVVGIDWVVLKDTDDLKDSDVLDKSCATWGSVSSSSTGTVMVTVPTVWMKEEEDETTGISTTVTSCNICTFPYNTTTVIPRILVGCGHTVCQECIQKFPRQEFVLCPFCRKPTSLTDNLPNRLPKNYAVLDIIHNLEE